MKRRAIQFFRRGRWLHLASQYITNPQRMRELVDTVSQYTHRRGIKKLRDNATRLWHYLSDVVTPIDFLPDILIGGLIDDLSVVLYIIKSTRKELEFYNLYSKGRLLGQ